jgi:minor curlin subunit
MKSIFIIPLIMGLSVVTLDAQINDGGFDEVFNSQQLQSNNLSHIQQIQDGNYIFTLQEQHGDLINNILVYQDGVKNMGEINQNGTGHSTSLLQNGNNNEANLLSTGQLTSTVVNQNGDWNKVNFSIENKDDFLKAAQVLQTGNNNLVDLKITGSRLFWESDVKDAVVAQTGNNHSFSAVLDSYKSPIVVNQQAGPNGEGMKVDISTSDFYFPNK